MIPVESIASFLAGMMSTGAVLAYLPGKVWFERAPEEASGGGYYGTIKLTFGDPVKASGGLLYVTGAVELSIWGGDPMESGRRQQLADSLRSAMTVNEPRELPGGAGSIVSLLPGAPALSLDDTMRDGGDIVLTKQAWEFIYQGSY